MFIHMYIVISMNIYITPINEKRLREAAVNKQSMSGLINQLLDNHFNGEKIEFKKVINTSEDAQKIIKTLPSRNAQFCKNGHSIPDGRDKCMTKGCQYGL